MFRSTPLAIVVGGVVVLLAILRVFLAAGAGLFRNVIEDMNRECFFHSEMPVLFLFSAIRELGGKTSLMSATSPRVSSL